MKAAMRAVKNSVMAFDEIEVKVREATSSDRWGVTDSQMGEIARATHNYNEYPKLFQMLWKRLTDVEHVMHVQKALILCEYLLRHGSERFVSDARRRSRDIAALVKYKHYDENNQDDAKEARAKAKMVNELLTDERRLAEERTKAVKLRENLKGIGSNDYAYGDNRGGYGGDEDRYAGNGGGADRYGAGAQPEYDNPYADEERSQPAPAPGRQRLQSSVVAEDPYAKAAAPAAALSEEEQAAERKRKKKEKKRREEAEAAAAAAAAGGAAANDDPFSSSVIPASVAPASAAVVPAPEEKKKKKKDKAAAAAASDSAAAQYAAMAAAPKAAAVAAPSSSADVDLSSFADNGRSAGRNGAASGDFDFLSGAGGGSGDLNDMFASSSISSQPTLWDQQSEQQAQANAASGNGSGQSTANPSSSPSAPKKDTWASDLFNLEKLDQAPAHPKQRGAMLEGGVSMSMMANLNPNAAPTPATNKRSSGNFSGMPGFGGMQQQQQQQGQQPQQQGQFGAPSPFAATGGFAAPGGYGQQPPPLGPQYGMAPGGYGQPAYGQPQMMGMQMGMGAPYGMQQQQQPGYGGFGAPQMQMQQQQPYGGGYGGQMGGQMGGGGGGGMNFHVPQQQQQAPQMSPPGPTRGQQAMASLDPFASLSQPSRAPASKMDFFVPAARK